jgi:hypothetical protein
MKLTPEQRKEIVRLLGDIRSDLAEIRRRFEKIREQLDARARG